MNLIYIYITHSIATCIDVNVFCCFSKSFSRVVCPGTWWAGRQCSLDYTIGLKWVAASMNHNSRCWKFSLDGGTFLMANTFNEVVPDWPQIWAVLWNHFISRERYRFDGQAEPFHFLAGFCSQSLEAANMLTTRLTCTSPPFTGTLLRVQKLFIQLSAKDYLHSAFAEDVEVWVACLSRMCFIQLPRSLTQFTPASQPA